MRIVALFNERDVIERTLRHLGLWQQRVRVSPARTPPEIVERGIEPWLDDLPAVSATQSLQAGPFPDYDTEPVMMYANGERSRQDLCAIKWQKREWKTIPAGSNAKTGRVFAELPKETVVYYFNITDEHNLTVSSEHCETLGP